MSSKINAIPTEKVYQKRKNVVSKDKCADCNSLCCHDLVMEIDPPSTSDDVETVMWYLHFKNSYIFLNEGAWYHMIRSQCRFLDKTTKLCTNYERRMNKCKEHIPPNCERYESWYDKIFEDPYQLQDYIEENLIIENTTSKKKNDKENIKKSSKKNK